MVMSNSMPVPGQFTRRAKSSLGNYDYTDWNAYNSSVVNWRRNQEDSRYAEGRKLLSDVMALFQDNGAYDQSFANAKNKFMAKSTSDMVSRGMGNLVNTPALNLAYEKEVRPEFEMGKQSRLASAMTAMANYIGSYRPEYEQFVQPMSVERVNGGSAFGNPFAGGPVRSGSSGSQSVSAGMGTPGDPVGQRLADLGASRTPFTQVSAGPVMMGSDPEWRKDYFNSNSPGLVAAGNSVADNMASPFMSDNPYLKFGPRA